MIKKLFGNKKGFTLVELTVTLAILGTVVALSSLLILSGGNVVYEHAALTEAKQVADAVMSVYRQKITFAENITLADNDDGTGECLNSNETDGRIEYRPVGETTLADLYSDDFYGNRKVTVKLEIDGETNVKVTVKVEYNGSDYTEESSVRALNVALGGKLEGGGGSYIIFTETESEPEQN